MAVTQAELGSRISGLRRALGLKQAELASALGIDQSLVSRIENGIRPVSSLELAQVAELLRTTPSDLLSESPLTSTVRAAARATADGDVSEGLDKATGLLHVHRVLARNGYEFPGLSLELPPIASGDAVAQGRAQAQNLRGALGLEGRPIRFYDLLSIAEQSLGMAVWVEPMDGHFDGICAHDGTFGVAVINSSRRWGNRQRFTLSHEIAHFLFQDTEDTVHLDQDILRTSSPMERRANAFAAELLLPLDLLRDAARGGALDEAAVVALAYRYGVSIESVVWTAYNNDLLTNAERVAIKSGRRQDQAREHGFAGQYAEDQKEQFRTLQSPGLRFLAASAYDAGVIGASLVSYVLGRIPGDAVAVSDDWEQAEPDAQ